MFIRKFLNIAAAILITASLLFGSVGQVNAQGISAAKANCAKLLNPKLHQGKITPADRKAAADCAALFGLQPATAMTAATTAAAPAPGAVPDYFGPYPNWAFSPLPVSQAPAVTIDPPPCVVDGTTCIQATAEATVNAVGVVTSITTTNAGLGYDPSATAPNVVITLPLHGGTPATATATVDVATTVTVTLVNSGSGYLVNGLRKFVDTLPGLGAANANNLGQYIPVATPDTNTYPGSDYYEIELGEYTEQLHSDLKPTTLRGYRQTNMGGTPYSYLGPIVIAQRDRPVRVKFTNSLPTGAGGNLFLPTDTSIMGSGMGPNGGMYTQNRATLHLHGGNTPWISDGTQHQWITPANEATAYPEGVAVENVPDMKNADGSVVCNTPTDGCQTFYYTNQQSARLLFYHDHAYGITRLNVYAGEAAGYLVTDSTEQGLISSGVLPDVGIPLVIQDKTFVDPTTVLNTDPTWQFPLDPTKSNLWLPHVYMPNQNPYDITGANAMGRWDYGQWFWPPFTNVTNGPIPNPYYDPTNAPWEPPMIPGTPNPSIAPEAFMDTPLVNGTAYPTVNVPAGLVRFRVLNAANDRYWNLSLWTADPSVVTPDGRTNTEVKMVPFNSSQNGITPFPSWWYDGSVQNPFDDRVGGVPDPSRRGPAMIQIGTEAGFLVSPTVIRNQPINYVMNKRDITVGNIAPNEHSLLLGPAERADVVVDFSNFAGKTLILYNDSPAPVPAADPRNDYFTGDPDQTAMGGAPTTLAGYGPNTRTIMQIVVGGSGGTAPVDDYNPTYFASLQSALTAAYGASQPKPLVPQALYNAPFNANYPADAYARISDNQMSFQGDAVTSLNLTNGGGGYTSAPTVGFTGGGGSGAAATATLGPAPVASLTLSNTGGFGYTTAPVVSFSGGGGTGASATAVLGATGGVRLATVTNGGTNYTSAPTLNFSAPPSGTRATGTATIGTSGTSKGKVTAITITNPGSGYSAAPSITFSGGGGTGAAATASLGRQVVSFTNLVGGSGYTSAPSVSIAAPPSSNCNPTSLCTTATATSTLAPRVIASLTLTNGGAGYTFAPTVTFTGGGGSNAAATAVIGKITVQLQPKSIIENFDPEYGRMNALLGVEIANTTGINQTSIPYSDIDAPTELFNNTPNPKAVPIGMAPDGTQIWKITHNGVDTHAIHWHMFDLQVINRVGWDGAIRPPEANEIGWKDTIRMNPLEDIIVALRPVVPTVPFGLPNSIRPLDVTMPVGPDPMIGAQTAGSVDPANNPITYNNQLINYGYEFVWHCHLLGHEENIMMRSIGVANNPLAPSSLVGTRTGSGKSQGAALSWIDSSYNETGWIIQQATNKNGPWTNVGTINIPLAKDAGYTTGGTVTFNVTGLSGKTTYYFQVVATDVVGLTQTFAAPAVGFPTVTANSQPSNMITIVTQ